MLGLAPVLAIYAANPTNRIISYHGLCHGTIAYQVANGAVPPTHPFLSGYPLRYPWGHHFLSGVLTRSLEITPFYAFAIINTLALLIALIFVFRTARRLLSDDKAGIMAAFVALYAASGPSVRMLDDFLVPRLDFLSFLDWRGVPVFEKFTNVSGVPLCIALFSVLLYTLIRICESRLTLPRLFMLFVSIAGCGFLYPQMLPGFVATSGAAWAVTAWMRRGVPFGQHAIRLIVIAGTCACALLIVAPYLIEISSGYAENVRLFERGPGLDNLLNLAFVSLPAGCLVLASRRQLIVHGNKVVLAVISVAYAANGLLYVCIAQPDQHEYKYLILAMVCLGILGGIGFHQAKNRLRRAGTLVVLALLVSNPAYEIVKKWSYHEKLSTIFVEQGRNTMVFPPEVDELYGWIRENTPDTSVFIDSTGWIPLLGQRALFVSLEPRRPCRVYDVFPVYDPILLHDRVKLAKELLAGKRLTAIPEKSVATFGRPLFVVDRERQLESRLDPRKWNLVFRSSDGWQTVFQFRGTESVAPRPGIFELPTLLPAPGRSCIPPLYEVVRTLVRATAPASAGSSPPSRNARQPSRSVSDRPRSSLEARKTRCGPSA
jgi:hypothetical protein